MQINQRLMSLMSHDLLGNLSSMAMLTHHHSDQHWDLLRQSSRSSVDLIKNLLLWSAHEGDFYRCSKEPVRLGTLVSEAVRQAQPAMSSKNLCVEGAGLKDETLVLVDIKMFQAILRNLLSNAIKYSPAGGKIEIHSKIEDGMVHLGIFDQGPGFDIERVKKILDQRGRPSSELSSAEGYGIGLFLVIQFLKLHGGHLDVDTAKGWGGRVVVVFPPGEQNS